MSHFQDGVRVGGAGYPPQGAAPGAQAPGVATSPVYVYSIVPSTLSTTNLATNQIVSGAPAVFTLTASTGVSTTSINGVTYYDLGVERSIRATGGNASTAAIALTYSGLTDYLRAVTCTWTGPSGTATTESQKTVRYVRGVSASGNSVSGIALGTGDTFGFPYRVNAFANVILNWSSTLVTSSAGFTAADTTDPATALTGNTRGKYAVQSASDGAKRLTAWIYVSDPNTTVGAYGVEPA